MLGAIYAHHDARREILGDYNRSTFTSIDSSILEIQGSQPRRTLDVGCGKFQNFVFSSLDLTCRNLQDSDVSFLIEPGSLSTQFINMKRRLDHRNCA